MSTNNDPLVEALEDLDPKWHDEFRMYMKTGQASEDFLRGIDEDENLQRAVETGLDALTEPYVPVMEALADDIERRRM